MNRIDPNRQGLASLGRDEDRYMAHVASGEMVVPPVITPETRQRLQQEMMAAGLSPENYTVGEGMSINPITGLPEFGWLKKTLKSIKKVAVKVAPILPFIPGVGTFLGGILGGVGSGITSLVSKIPGIGGALSSGIGSLGSFFSPAAGATGMFGGTIGPSIRSGIGSLFGGGMGGTVEVASGDTLSQIAAANNTTVEALLAANPGITNPNMIQIGQKLNIPGGASQFSGLFGPDSVADKLFNVDPNKGTGPLSFLGGNNSGGGMGGLGSLGIAGFLGKMAYDSAKKKEGGISETPKVTMDQLGRYQLASDLGTGGTRGEFGLAPKPAVLTVAGGGPIDNRMYYAEGGVAELDMRDGGESEGSGTGTSDDIPAMLSDGEFVFTAAATQGAGAYDVKKKKTGIELIKTNDADRERGVTNLREVMNIFEAI